MTSMHAPKRLESSDVPMTDAIAKQYWRPSPLFVIHTRHDVDADATSLVVDLIRPNGQEIPFVAHVRFWPAGPSLETRLPLELDLVADIVEAVRQDWMHLQPKGMEKQP